jgi:demethylmenaquinone methyltransferase/2-methoxy-6-polyprenyl-1,4-benzoquinol methylase
MPDAPSAPERNAGGKSPREVREMFARVARRYDLLNHLLSLGQDIRWRRAAAREVAGLVAEGEAAGHGAATAVLADLCAGTGDLALAFRTAAPKARVVALDFTPEMLCLGPRKAAQAGLGGICFALGDALRVPLRDASVAAAGVAFGIRNVADLDAALREMSRIVRPGGKVLILEFTRPRGRFFGPLYLFYFRRVLPLLGRVISRTSGDAYRYLPRSVSAFAGPEGMAERMRAAGLSGVRAVPLTCGVVHLYVGVRKQPEP